MRAIRALVADDHPEVLAALVTGLEEDARFRVVATATTGDEAVRSAGTTSPHVVLLDVQMPGGGVPAALALAALPRPPVVVAVSAQAGPWTVAEMIRAGAVGYLLKGRVGDALGDLVARCVDGEVLLAVPDAANALTLLRRPSAHTV